MFIRQLATIALLTPLALTPVTAAHAAQDTAPPSTTGGGQVTGIHLPRLDANQPALAANGCARNDAYDWVGSSVDIGTSGPAAKATQDNPGSGGWHADLVYRSGGRVRARIPLTGSYNGKFDGFTHDVTFDIECSAFTRLAHAGFGSRVSTDAFGLTDVRTTIAGTTYRLGASPLVHQRVRQLYRAVARIWRRSGTRVTIVGAAQRWVRRSGGFGWRNTGGGVPVLLRTSCQRKTGVRRTGPRGRFVLTTSRASFRDRIWHRTPMVETEIRNTRTRSGDVDGWWWRPAKHSFGETAWGLYCEGD